MNICGSYSHEEIVYVGKNCPLCQANAEIAQLEDQITDLEAAE